MRINRFVASALGISRRAADALILAKEVQRNNKTAQPSDQVVTGDIVMHAGKVLSLPNDARLLIMLNKPVGYICSHKQQGSTPTIYSLLPPEYRRLNTVGRLDKDSSGLLLLTDDGDLLFELTHPKFIKDKVYEVALDKPLDSVARQSITKGVALGDGLSALQLSQHGSATHWRVTMHEGRNRQIRRTFHAVGAEVIGLHRTHFGDYTLPATLEFGKYTKIL